MKPLTVSGVTNLVTVTNKDGSSSYYRLWLRNDGTVVALPMLEKPDEDN